MASAKTDRLPNISRGFVTATGATVGLDFDRARGGVGAVGRRAKPGEVETVVGSVGGGRERRTLLGIGTYLIDTPRDSGLHLRQRFLDHQEQHRGVAITQEEHLPDVPFRVHPKPGLDYSSYSDLHSRINMVDVATSPMPLLDDGSDQGSESPSNDGRGIDHEAEHPSNDSRGHVFLTESSANSGRGQMAGSPIPPLSRTVSFMTNREVTSLSMMAVNDANNSMWSVNERGNRKNKGTSTRELAKDNTGFVQRKDLKQRTNLKEVSKLSEMDSEKGALDESYTNDKMSRESHMTDHVDKHVRGHMTERLPRLPLTARREAASMKKSSSVTDLTDVGSTFSWRDKDFELKTYRSFDLAPEQIGHTSYLQRAKSKSLGDLLKTKGDNPKPPDMAAYHKRQRIAQLAFRRENTYRRNSTLSSNEDADREWIDMKNTQVVDKSEYERFASRRKPTSSESNGKKNKKSFSPRPGKDFQISQPVNGKAYPVFFNDGSPVRKFGRVVSKRKVSRR